MFCAFFFFFGGGTVLLPIQELHELLFCYIINMRKQFYFHGLILMNLTNRIRIVSLTRKTSWHPLEENHILEGRCDGADDAKWAKTLFTQSLSVLSFLILVHSTPSTGTTNAKLGVTQILHIPAQSRDSWEERMLVGEAADITEQDTTRTW